MTLVAKYYDHLTDTTQTLDISNRIRVPGFSVTANAEEGSVALCKVEIDDPLGELDFTGMRRVYFYETSAPALNQHIFDGFLADATVSRGPGTGLDDDIHVTGTARRWTLNMADVNSLMSRKIVVSSTWQRPSETDVARVQALLGTRELGPVQNTAGYVSTTGPVTMDSANYITQTAWDVMNDCAQHSGKNWFAFFNEPTDAYSLFYDFAGSSAYDSGIRLTNVEADVDNTTTFIILDEASITRDPSRLADQILLGYNGGYVRVGNTITGDTYFGADFDRWLMMPATFTTSATVATTLANRYLTEASTPDDRITCAFIVAKEKVNVLKEGQRVQVKITHFFTEYAQSYVYARCLKRTVTQLTDDRYRLDVELSPSLVGPGGDESGEPAQAALYAPGNGAVGGGRIAEPGIRFGGTGDGPDLPGGSTEIPLIGSLSYIQNPNWPATELGKYSGLLVSGNGTLSIRFKTNFIMVVNTSHPTMTFRVMVDGATAGSFSIQETACTGLCSWGYEADFTALDVAVTSGQVITAQMELSGSLSFTVPGGTGNPSYGLFVSGTLT